MAVLFIDCYDSFSYNITRLFEIATGADLVVVHNDSISEAELLQLLPYVDAVIVGPGPGNPCNHKDAGIIPMLWSLPADLQLPIFGVCFGFQAMAHGYGGSITRLPEPKHGQKAVIHVDRCVLYNGIERAHKVVRYHSLCVNIQTAPDLVEIARCFDNGIPVVMALRHKALPLYAVQYHPESVLSHHGQKLMANFWAWANKWNGQHRTVEQNAALLQRAKVQVPPLLPPLNDMLTATVPPIKEIDNIDVMAYCTSLRARNKEFVLLHSARLPGKWSIVGIVNDNTYQLRCKGSDVWGGPLRGTKHKLHESFWQAASSYMRPRIVKSDSILPFLGGFVGYVTYEASYASMDRGAKAGKALQAEIYKRSGAHSDASFVFIEDCVVTDGQRTWAVGTPPAFSANARTCSDASHANFPKLSKVDRPTAHWYKSKIERCYEYLRSGDSYELCLTAQTQLRFEAPVDPWSLFRRIVDHNPAPYHVYLNYDDTLVGSSPERFMSWDRKGVCRFQPIKGTVQRQSGTTFEDAVAILGSQKEVAENLMIVDLIRHDLSQLLKNVRCPLLMSVEEYETVFQLVSVIEGDLPAEGYKGIDVLSHSLPPGSMTGAPKLRSVDLLNALEESPRSLYSGVSGYWSTADTGDWCVTIRSAFRHYDEETWRIGAGGAITVLSQPEAEFREMETKLEAVLAALDC